MPLVPAKCPECGGLVEVDSEKRAGLCQHCSQPFVVEDAIQTFNTYYNTTNNYNTTYSYGEGSIVNIYEEKNKDFVIEGGVLKAYHGESVDIIIPRGVNRIASGCFKKMNIKSVTFPDELEYIDYGAFVDCFGIKNLIFPRSLKEINNGFYCDGWYNHHRWEINEICIYNTTHVTGFGYCTVNKLSVKHNSLSDGKLIIAINDGSNQFFKEVFVEEGITKVECMKITAEKVYLPRTVNVIEKDAFYNGFISNLIVEGDLKEIKDYAFRRVKQIVFKHFNADCEISNTAFCETHFNCEDAPDNYLIAYRKSHMLCLNCGGKTEEHTPLFGDSYVKCNSCGRKYRTANFLILDEM